MKNLRRLLSGVFVRYSPDFLRFSNLAYGSYFPTTRAASRAIGYKADKVGYDLRCSKGTRQEGKSGWVRGFRTEDAFLFITVGRVLKGWRGLEVARSLNPGLFAKIREAQAAAGVG